MFAPAVSAPDSAPTLDWSDEETCAAVRRAVRTRTAYPEAGLAAAAIELVQTHISSVLLTPAFVFKFKRPVDVGFVDMTTLAARRALCMAEVTLNRRLASDVYLGTLPLYATAHGYSLVHGERVVDWCVVMRRLPRADMLDARLRSGTVGAAEVEALARRLVAFHNSQEPRPEFARFGSVAQLRENWEENFRQAAEGAAADLLAPDLQAQLRGAVERALGDDAALFRRRAEGGFIRDGHGDLRCEHVYLGPNGDLKIIDCIEFNDRFRYGDVANDLAFLLMDLVACGRPDLARSLMARYAELSGDGELPRLVPFYAAYRAYVRCKVAVLKLAQGGAEAEQAQLQARARAFLRLAHAFSQRTAPPLLVLVAGLMGTGKTTLCEALAAQGHAPAYSSDAERKRLAGDAARTGRTADFGEGLYSAAWNRRTYDALFERAAAALRAGESVLLDASFSRRALRAEALALAQRHGARLVLIECRLPPAQTRARLRRRTAAGTALSDGREALYEQQQAAFEAVTELPPDAHHIVSTDRPAGELAADVLRRLHLPPPLFAGLPAVNGGPER